MLNRITAILGFREMRSTLKTVSWNLGSLQTNTLEFWQPEGSPLRRTQELLDAELKTHVNTPISNVFTHQMMTALCNFVDIDRKAAIFDNYAKISEVSVYDFLTDKTIGRKRFVSMADRVLREHPTFGLRPSLITGSVITDESIHEWWNTYKSFLEIVDPVRTMVLRKHNSDKYGNKGFSTYELEYYVELQLLHLAISDACFVYISKAIEELGNTISDLADTFSNKFVSIKSILTSIDADILCLQEVDASSLENFDGYVSVKPSKSYGKQDSIILLRKGIFDSIEFQSLETPVIGPGDLVLIRARHVMSGRKFLIASFHGDANGLSTIPFLRDLRQEVRDEDIVIIGSDTNAHYDSGDEGSKLKYSTFESFVSSYSWEIVNKGYPTTRSCRTFFQAQAHKGHHAEDIQFASDPKDNIIFRDLTLVDSHIIFGESESAPIPNKQVPSDHAIVLATLDLKDKRSEL
jgi:hypothetical protein